MKKLTAAKIESYRRRVADIRDDCANLRGLKARFECPLGEWIGNLQGVAWAFKMLGKTPDPQPMTGKEGWNAQGLEGKIVIETDLVNSIIYYSQSEPNRASIYLHEGIPANV